VNEIVVFLGWPSIRHTLRSSQDRLLIYIHLQQPNSNVRGRGEEGAKKNEREEVAELGDYLFNQVAKNLF
jgi:hypothetical protein